MKIFPKFVNSKIAEKEEEELPFCKICFETTNTIDNKLIHPCKCKGSIKFVHEKCILKWFQQSDNAKKTCEICKYEYVLKKVHYDEIYFFYKDILYCKIEILLYLMYILSCSFLATIYGIVDTTNNYSWTKIISNNNTISIDCVKFLYITNGASYEWTVLYYFPMGVYTVNIFFILFFIFLPYIKVYQFKLYYRLIYKHYLLLFFCLNLYLFLMLGFLQQAQNDDYFYFFLYVNIVLTFLNYPVIKVYMQKHDLILKEINRTHNILKIMNYKNENIPDENVILQRININDYDFVYNPLNLIPEQKLETLETLDQEIVAEENLNNLVLEIKSNQ